MQIADNLNIDPKEFAIQGNAVLGIRDSGKTYTATAFAEKLMDNNIPIIVFDPIGVWRYLKVGRDEKHKGYPIVVAGDNGDLPLTPASAPSIVRAAMKEGVSLVLDLFSMELSKNDWKKIVESCLQVLLYENKKYGLRHVFIEEAAEFAPQKIQPDQGRVYAAMEKLARMGGNSSLGYTLINQRAEEVNKAVLELCDCLFLHRQKGRHSITAIGKWLDASETVNVKEITKSLPSLEKGECWAWVSGSQEPVKIQVLPKNTLHPDRRNPVPYESATKKDVTSFVERMNQTLQAQNEGSSHSADSQNDSAPAQKSTRKQIKKDTSHSNVVPAQNDAELKILKEQLSTAKQQLSQKDKDWQKKLDEEKAYSKSLISKIEAIKKHFKPQYDSLHALFEDSSNTVNAAIIDKGKWQIWLDKLPGKNATMLEKLIEHGKLTKKQLALHVGMSASAGGFNNYLSKLKTLNIVVKEGEFYVLQNMVNA